ncbi:MAG: hypothetical protein AAF677_11955 [Pseudomonadota bacterium]
MADTLAVARSALVERLKGSVEPRPSKRRRRRRADDGAVLTPVRCLIDGLQGVGHVIADAASDADDRRRCIADDLCAKAQIKQNPARAGAKPWIGHDTRRGTWSGASSTASDTSVGWHCAAKRPSQRSGQSSPWLAQWPRSAELNTPP